MSLLTECSAQLDQLLTTGFSGVAVLAGSFVDVTQSMQLMDLPISSSCTTRLLPSLIAGFGLLSLQMVFGRSVSPSSSAVLSYCPPGAPNPQRHMLLTAVAAVACQLARQKQP